MGSGASNSGGAAISLEDIKKAVVSASPEDLQKAVSELSSALTDQQRSAIQGALTKKVIVRTMAGKEVLVKDGPISAGDLEKCLMEINEAPSNSTPKLSISPSAESAESNDPGRGEGCELPERPLGGEGDDAITYVTVVWIERTIKEIRLWADIVEKKCKETLGNGKDGIIQAFRIFDDDETGKISFKNLKRRAKELGEKLMDEELQEMIDEADRDGDGEVNEEEFMRVMLKSKIYAS
eukprot:TRINITY_DN24003_c0_g1_i1.p1 TRINITY_DN24003_c0_g1~~TRINITY_DN24003_c0_g1_i1.p1  ORF type:complete len:238 (+),score=46.18 TRINITY_DN24003_c0_g1_i1:53-766(+)